MTEDAGSDQDWVGRFVAPVQYFPEAPRLRKEFILDPGHGPIRSAELALSALGVQETWLNGERVGDDLLEPGWTSYEWRIGYRTYDVTTQLAAANVLGMVIGNGWYRGHLGWESRAAIYGDRVAGFAELRVVFADGHRQVVATDESWTCSPSEIDADDLYNGQTIDARRRDETWLRPGTPAGAWSSTIAVDDVTGRLEESRLPPVRMQEAIAPVETRALGDDRVLLDFGQNLVGWIRLTVSGAPGGEVTVRHAEVLEHGELAVRPLRSAEATDRYRLSGGEDLFEPTFTWHGFRYAELRLPRDSTWRAEAVVVGSLLTRTGTFHCSDPLVNRLHENVVWSTRGNFLSIPTDCPQRDERLGWTGDIAVFAPTASFLFDVEDFLASWCRDLALEQAAAGVPFVVPDPLKYGEPPMGMATTPVTAIWSDAAIWVPWALWQAYGSTAIAEAQFESMTRHLDSVRARLGDNGCWADDGFQFGDWLDPAAPPDRPGEARADNFVVATACAYRSATMFADLAAATERADIAAEARALAERIRAGFRAGYLEPDGRIRSDAPTVYAIAIAFGILTEDEAARSGDRLAALVAENGYRISTGFAGTPYISEALSSSGHHDVAVRLLLERECPSWLYPVTMGATTMWERWDSMLPDGTVNPGEMTSFNHYALGSVADWLHRSVAGLAPAAPGYAAIRFAPGPAEGIDDAAAELETPHGRAAIAWRRDGQSLAVDLVVPDGVPAVLVGPNGVETPVEPGTSTHVLAL